MALSESLRFLIAHHPVPPEELRQFLLAEQAGGYCSFEGWVRNHNEGWQVRALDYEVYESLAQKEGMLILQEAQEKFAMTGAVAMHRAGALAIGDIAVWIGVAAPHRDAAFRACRYIIDEIKHRLPVWKKEHYRDAESRWVACHHTHH